MPQTMGPDTRGLSWNHVEDIVDGHDLDGIACVVVIGDLQIYRRIVVGMEDLDLITGTTDDGGLLEVGRSLEKLQVRHVGLPDRPLPEVEEVQDTTSGAGDTGEFAVPALGYDDVPHMVIRKADEVCQTVHVLTIGCLTYQFG